MGIDIAGLRALQAVKRLYDADFSKTVMLGRQEIHFRQSDARRLAIAADLAAGDMEQGTYAEPLFKALGADHIDSIDASDYEGATIRANFNQPLPPNLDSDYTFYCDFGSIEHIFKIEQVVLNISKLLRVGGDLLIVTNCDGLPSHGFYQFSPEFFYTVFGPTNGFSRTVVFIVQLVDGRWFHVMPPALMGRRSRMEGLKGRCYVICFSRKVAPTTTVEAQQSDYALAAWQNNNAEKPRSRPTKKRSAMGEILRQYRFNPLMQQIREPLTRIRKAYKVLFFRDHLGEDLREVNMDTIAQSQFDAFIPADDR